MLICLKHYTLSTRRHTMTGSQIWRPSRLLPSGDGIEDFELMNEDFQESELSAVVEESTVHSDIEGDKGIFI